jgi:hypothetical protein
MGAKLVKISAINIRCINYLQVGVIIAPKKLGCCYTTHQCMTS